MNRKKGFATLDYIIVASIVIVFTLVTYTMLKKDEKDYIDNTVTKIENREEFIGKHVVAYHPPSSIGFDVNKWQDGDPNSGLIEDHVNVETIDFMDGDQYTALVGDVFYIEASVYPETATKQELVWTVNSGGETIIPSKIDSSTIQITGASPGVAVIEARATDGSGTKKRAYITIKQPVTGIAIETDKTILSATTSEVAYIQATVKPENATEKRVNWSFGNGGIGSECLKFETSNNSHVLTVTAVRDCKGKKTKIVATTLDGSYTAEVEFTITR